MSVSYPCCFCLISFLNLIISVYFGNLSAIDSKISLPVGYYNTANVQDQSQHPPYYVPSCAILEVVLLEVPVTSFLSSFINSAIRCNRCNGGLLASIYDLKTKP
ncbi:hypothetical protein SLEP1_g35353 [Rubroshorea leprosula]|uniref:Secreted protein n=1 Tax=Rubroshorea leprosula TaxID=152421 RepID=A0AAV5KMV1_9ROSI|nr:hypothetical protein SLEP1_g35353 [Rubroshorea leprosula]